MRPKNAPSDASTSVAHLKAVVAAFIRERDWERFHAPKNVAVSLAVEAAELLEIFQWLEPAESAAVLRRAAVRRRVENEIADVASYLLDFCTVAGIDLSAALSRKMAANARKYPADLARGRHSKYTAYVRRAASRKTP